METYPIRFSSSLPSEVPPEYSAFTQVFTEEEFNKFPPERPWDHEINLKPDAPTSISAHLYPLTPDKMEACRLFVDEHLKTRRIIPSKSPYVSSFFFVKKADNSLRPVMDYRKINEWTVPDHYPLPLIEPIIESLSKARYFTKLDIRWGFNNVRMKPGHSKFTAFITPFGCYEPTVMFFGLCNSPATFQRMMNDLFGPLLRTGCILIYMDDILIFSQDLTSHIKIVKEVLQVLKDNHLSLKPSKCAFHKESVEYLGRVISHGTVTIRPAHTLTISKWPVPKDKTGIQ